MTARELPVEPRTSIPEQMQNHYPALPSAPGDDCTAELAVKLAEAEATIARLHAAMEETREPAWIIRYEDQDRGDEFYSGAGATEAALKRFDMVSCGYNCHLFRRVAVG